MANSALHPLNDATPTLIFSGVGNVVIRIVGGSAYLGGPGVTMANGVLAPSDPLVLNVNSPDEIWAIASTSESPSAAVLEVR